MYVVVREEKVLVMRSELLLNVVREKGEGSVYEERITAVVFCGCCEVQKNRDSFYSL